MESRAVGRERNEWGVIIANFLLLRTRIHAASDSARFDCSGLWCWGDRVLGKCEWTSRQS